VRPCLQPGAPHGTFDANAAPVALRRPQDPHQRQPPHRGRVPALLVDRITYTAACAKKFGVLASTARGVHFEFPRAARDRGTMVVP
jgi:hypothetical protein